MDNHASIISTFHTGQSCKGMQSKPALDSDADVVGASGWDRSSRRGVTVIVLPQLYLIPPMPHAITSSHP